MAKFLKVILFISLPGITFIFLLSLTNNISLFAQNGEEPTCPPPPPSGCSDSWSDTEYQCLGSCGGTLQQRTRSCSWSCAADPIRDEQGCITGYRCVAPCSSGCGAWSSWSNIQTCAPVQSCSASPPGCQCAGQCFPPPELILVTGVQENVFDSSDKAKLPLMIDWEDRNVSPCTVGSYRHEFSGGGETVSNFSSISETKMEGCQLKSNTGYDWRVRTCIDSQGNDCGGWSPTQNFSTSLAPEPLLPYDPDWEGSGRTENVSPPVTLDWCDVSGAESWLMEIYLVENGGETCHPWLLNGEGNCEPWVIRKEGRPPPYPSQEALYSEFSDQEKGFFTKDTEYKWAISTCLREDGFDCSDFSQNWKFKTSTTSLQSFQLISPPNDPGGNRAVALPVVLDWEDKPGINSFIYEINPGGITGVASTSQIRLDYPTLSLDTLYRWRTRPCWDFQGRRCEQNFSNEWRFRTTGAPPGLNYPSPNVFDIPIPVKFDWEDIPGAGSYKYEVSVNSSFTNIAAEGVVEGSEPPPSEISVDYPNLRMLTDYWWRVRTCADKEGSICGVWGEIRNFRTFKLPPPSNPYPPNVGQFFTYERYISWQNIPEARAYQYRIRYLSLGEERDETCFNSVGGEIISPKTISTNSDFLTLGCLGEYEWSARACLDKECQEAGDWAGPWFFTFSQPTPPKERGLVPCGRISDIPDTPWNEREPCQFKHIFLMLKNILDFLLWRLIPIILVLLAIATGAIFYFSMGAPATLVNVRVIWKSAGIGVGIIFLAWTIIDLILVFLGFQVGIFGRWWEIKF